MRPTLRDKFRGCLLGATVGDVIGAAVEAESPGYIAATYRSVDDILAAGSVPEFAGPAGQVGRFTDDTQMMLGVAEWLLAGEAPSAERLLARLAAGYEPWRRYGPGMDAIVRLYARHPAQWRDLATAAFPQGSYGNGSAARVAPVGLACSHDPAAAAALAMESSRPTHTHPLAYQGAVLQALAVGAAVRCDPADCPPAGVLAVLRAGLGRFADLMQDTSPFARALDAVEAGLARGASCGDMAAALGTGMAAYDAVPMGVYCFLRHRDSFADAVRQAVFLGGDTDTIAAMAGALAGALLGRQAIPAAWVGAIREEKYPPVAIEDVADRLFVKYERI